MSIGPYIIYLPDIALERIFSFLSYDEIAKNRVVCKKFNDVGSKYLSRSFIQVEKRHMALYKRVKSLLPRRESERRSHPLAKHCDILSAVETRISMLNMTFMKYIENGLCCFIPGKVIDEIERVLGIVESDGPPPRTHELLQELRDISSMAMEHFDEQILPSLKLQIEQPPSVPLVSSPSKSSKLILVQYAIVDEVRKVRKQTKSQKLQITTILNTLEKFQRKIKRQNIRIKAQTTKLKEHERKIQDQSVKMQEQECAIAEMKKHMDEWEQKFSDLTAEVRARDDFISKVPNNQAQSLSQSVTKCYLPKNIMPRTAQVLPKHYGAVEVNLDRKRKSLLAIDIPSKLPRHRDAQEPSYGKLISSVSSILSNTSGLGSRTANAECDREVPSQKSDIGTFITSSLETLLKNPIASMGMKARKRKMSEDIDLK